MVGQNVLEHPAANEHEIFSPPRAELDLRDFSSVEAWFKKNQPEAVIHAAGKVGGIQANIREPVRFLVDNLDIGRNVVLAARNTGVRYFLNLGSSCMYPRNASNPLIEESILQGEIEPTNEGYALAKIVATRLCQYIAQEAPDINYKTLIPCNIYGRHDSFDPSRSHMVPAIIDKLHQAKIKQLKNVEIWGDGTARREFMYAGDLADCIWKAVVCYEDLPSVMNVGVGNDLTVDEYYSIAAEVVGYAGRFSHDLSKPAGMKQKLVDVTRAESWGWKACTPLRNGLSRTYQFYLEKKARDEYL